MSSFYSPQDYLFHLQTTSSSEARRLWRQSIKEKWDYKCAYCGSEENLTLDHVIPQSKGGVDTLENVVCCCHSCNHSKGHTDWKEWYYSQDFFSSDKEDKIDSWLNSRPKKELYRYKQRRNDGKS